MKSVPLHVLLVCIISAALAGSAYAVNLPRPDHVVVVIEENRSFANVMHKRNSASYIHALAKRGVLFTQSYGITHPSQPNYLALFSGATHGILSNSCPHRLDSDNLATRLLDSGLSFVSFSESLPQIGDKVCKSGAYQRKHNPMVNWQDTRLPANMNQRFSDFPQDFSKLPTVAFVIPDQDNDMHDGSFAQADTWLETHIKPYVEWAMQNNSLLILTWDEGSYTGDNRIATILIGPMLQAGSSEQVINHYNVLRTLLEFYNLPALGESREAAAISGVWKPH